MRSHQTRTLLDDSLDENSPSTLLPAKNNTYYKKSQLKKLFPPFNILNSCYDIEKDTEVVSVKAIRKNFCKIFKFFLLISLIGILTVAGLNIYMVLFSRQYTMLSQDTVNLSDVDCIMVLGCGVRGDSPTPLLADRLQRGVEVFELGSAPKILMSGDHGQDNYDEVNVMKQYALDAGIAETDIFMDHAGFSTYESMYRAKEVFGVKKMIIVTQKYHLSRAVYIANKLGIEAYGVASDYQTFSGQLGRDTREILARVKDIFTVMLKPKPTYLGEAIPISGDGTATNG